MNIVKTIFRVVWVPSYKIQRDLMDKSEVSKLEQAIDVHGYRGISKKKHNGVVNIKPDDTQLLKALDKFKKDQINQKFVNNYISEAKELTQDIQFLIDVKVVAHCPSGNRIVGSLYIDNNNDQYILFLFCFSNYNYQIF